ncbi:hypothetical protein DFS34DRAFT_613126 [Phlyctochytrium arcticum]|nr:hypothetical protein DFS34DRAFT_613126 [Phlyctochytrium arcticum]
MTSRRRKADGQKSSILSGIVVYFATDDDDEKNEIQHLIEQHGGISSEDLQDQVTHYLANTVINDTYRLALLMEVPIVSPEWIRHCCSLKKKDQVDPLVYMCDYELPPLAGLRISMTNFVDEKREELATLIKHGGGQLAPEFHSGCTQLVAACAGSLKFDTAQIWKVPVVSEQWLHDCLAQDAYLEESLYPVMTTSLTPKVLPVRPRPADYLNKCAIFVGDGFDGQELARIKMWTKAGRAAVVKTLDLTVTHYISRTTDLSDSDLSTLESSMQQPVLVDHTWLRDCYRQRMLIPTTGYRVKIRSEDALRQQRSTKTPKIKKSTRQWEELGEGFDDNSENTRDSRRKQRSADISLSHLPHLSKRPIAKVLKDSTRNPRDRSSSERTGIFAKYTFRLVGLQPQQIQNLEAIISSSGGMIAHTSGAAARDGTKILSIVPIEGAGRVGMPMFTDFWVEKCSEDNVVYKSEDHFLFQPLPARRTIAGFAELQIGISGFVNAERTYLIRAVHALGAECSESFSRLRTSFLLCKHGVENDKSRKAVEWRIPIVDEDWLVDCLAKGSVVGKMRKPVRRLLNRPTAQREKLAAIPVLAKPPEDPDLDIVDDELPATGRYQPRFDTLAIMQSLQTPAPKRPSGSVDSLNSSPLDVSFRRNLANAAKAARNIGKTSRPRSQSTNSSTAFSVLSSDVLKGVVICLSSKLTQQRGEVYPAAIHLGAELLIAYSDTCTHFMHQGSRVNEVFKDFRDARKAGKHIVSPAWLFACEAQAKHVKESDYPHTYNPSRSLSLSTPSTTEGRLLMDSEDEHTTDGEYQDPPGSVVLTPNISSTQIADPFTINPKTPLISSSLQNVATEAAAPGVAHDQTPVLDSTRPKEHPAHTSITPPSLLSSHFDTVVTRRTALDRGAQTPVLSQARAHPQLSRASLPLASQIVSEFVAPDPTPDSESRPIVEQQEDNAPQVNKFAAIMDRLFEARQARRRVKPSSEVAPPVASPLLGDASEANGSIWDDEPSVAVRQYEEFLPTQKKTGARLQEEIATIVYDDPEARIAKRKLLEQITPVGSKRTRSEEKVLLSSDNETDDGEALADKMEVQANDLPGDIPSVRTDGSKLAESTGNTILRQANRTMSVQAESLSVVPIVISSGEPYDGESRLSPDPVTRQDKASAMTSELSSVPPIPSNVASITSSLSEFDLSNPTEPVQIRKFQLSGFPRADRIRMAKTVVSLGGIVLQGDVWNLECSHLVASKPARTEKPLAAMASGGWVLKPQYLDASARAGKFVDEVLYEWTANNDTPPEDRLVFQAPQKWRLRVEEQKRKGLPEGQRPGSYTGWRVLLVVDTKKRDGFQRLLEAGGAKVVLANPRTHRALRTETFTFVVTDHQPPMLRQNPLLVNLATRGTLFIDTNYCGEYLFMDPAPPMDKYTVHVLDLPA